MVHTLPDYTTKYKMTKIFGNIDTGELAARLGSCNTFDRRGSTIWMDDFEEPILRWSVIGGLTLGDAVLSTAKMQSGAQSCKINTGDTNGFPTIIRKDMDYSVAGRLGFEFAQTRDALVATMIWEAKVYDGTWLHFVRLTYTDATGIVSVYNSAGAEETIATVPFFGSGGTEFIHMKFVFDMTTHRMVRFIHEDRTYDISNVLYWCPASGNPSHIELRMYVDGDVGQDRTIYLDDVIVTQNEP